jgi:pyruvate formate lyase activating enzyme
MTNQHPKTINPSERARLEKVEGVIFDIQRYSLHDGPGLRTNIFLKGCPLHCRWCANPESQHLQPELALFAHHCINCGQHAKACPVGWESRNGAGWTEELQAEYNDRAAVCPTEAIHWIGERRTAGEVMKEVLRDAPFYEDGGGMTITGGEPTLQPDMAEALLRLAKAEYISTAIETCGHTQWAVLERLLPYLDLLLFDLKHMDSTVHRAHTGVGNQLILSNIRRVAALNVPLVIRVPLIPGFNASVESLQAIAGFVLKLGSAVKSVDLLPYHTLGQAKYRALGREYPWKDHKRLTNPEVEAMAKVIEPFGLTVNIGG